MHPRMIKKKISYEKHALQPRLIMKQHAPQARLIKPDFLIESSWVLCHTSHGEITVTFV